MFIMTGKKFLNSVSKSRVDLVQLLLEVLAETGAEYCVIGGLAVNAYAEPVVSLDLDLVVEARKIESVCKSAEDKGLNVRPFEHSINISSPHSDLRIQLQIDARYQAFLPRAVQKDILGYPMKVAALKDVLIGKIWSYLDETRRKSKRQKDLADIYRLLEAYPDLKKELPRHLRKKLE